MYQIIAAAVGALLGGMTEGITTAVTTNEKVKALQRAAQQANDMANKYSGAELNRKMTEAGNENALATDRDNMANQLNRQTNNTGSSMANANTTDIKSNYEDYYKQGAERENMLNQAEYGKEKADIERNLAQADVNYNVANQTAQAGLNAAGGLAQVGAAISDENAKEPPLPHADIQDSLRQIESVEYKYKDGLPQDGNHVGTTAQSLEKTPLFASSVIDGDIKKVDIWKLNEAVTAGIAELQREIDELRGDKCSKE